MRYFQVAITDRTAGPASKRWGALDVVIQLFKLYFRLNNLKLCKTLTKHVETAHFIPLEQFPMSQQVTYRYYVGRLAMFDGDYARAEAALAFAFLRCTKRSQKNKR